MSIQADKRKKAIVDKYDSLMTDPAKAVSKLVEQTAELKVFVTFLHDNLLNNKGDISEGDRVVLKNALVPLYSQIEGSLAELTSILSISNDDPVIWQANFDSFLADNPTILKEALNYFPTVD